MSVIKMTKQFAIKDLLLLAWLVALTTAVVLTDERRASDGEWVRRELKNRTWRHELRLSDLERYTRFVDGVIDDNGDALEATTQVLRGQVKDLIRRVDELEHPQ
jgi:hypothetical protein